MPGCQYYWYTVIIIMTIVVLVILILLFFQSWHALLSIFLSRCSESYQMWHISEERFSSKNMSLVLCFVHKSKKRIIGHNPS